MSDSKRRVCDIIGGYGDPATRRTVLLADIGTEDVVGGEGWDLMMAYVGFLENRIEAMERMVLDLNPGVMLDYRPGPHEL